MIGSCWVVTAAHCILVGKVKDVFILFFSIFFINPYFQDKYSHETVMRAVNHHTFQVRTGRQWKEDPKTGEEKFAQSNRIKNIFIHRDFKGPFWIHKI